MSFCRTATDLLAEGLAVYLQAEIGRNPAFPNFGWPLHALARELMPENGAGISSAAIAASLRTDPAFRTGRNRHTEAADAAALVTMFTVKSHAGKRTSIRSPDRSCSM